MLFCVFLTVFTKTNVWFRFMEKVTLINADIEAYAENHVSWVNDLSDKIVYDTTHELAYADMLSGNQVTGLLRFLIQISGARTTAEIGLFTGLASLAIIEALPENGMHYALEMNTKYRDIAIRNLSKSQHYQKFNLIFGSARETINELPNNLDLVFLDADKDYYPSYYDVLVEKLRQGGIMVLDNVFWYGGVLQTDKDRKSTTLDNLNKHIHMDKRVENVMLTIRDGLMIVRKK